MARLMLNGKLPSKEELATDDLVVQMLQEAEAKGKAEAKESIIQALTIEEIPEAIKQALIPSDIPTKESVLQALTIEDVPEAIKQAIIESVSTVPPAIEGFVKQAIGAAISEKGGGSVNDDDKKEKKSVLRQAAEASAQFRI